jgi:hypothetical protein
MKKAAVLVGLMVIFASGVAHANFIGAIDTQHNKNFSLGAMASYNSVERNAGSGEKIKATQQEAFALFGFGVKGWKIDLGGGVYNADYKSPAFAQDIDGDIEFFLRGGVGGPIFVGRVLSIGPFVQASYYPEHDQTVTIAGNPPQKITFDNTIDVVGGMRFQVDLEGAQLYAAPTIFWSEGDHRTRKFGAMAGINWPLYTGLHLGLEGHLRDDAGFSYTLALNFPF